MEHRHRSHRTRVTLSPAYSLRNCGDDDDDDAVCGAMIDTSDIQLRLDRPLQVQGIALTRSLNSLPPPKFFRLDTHTMDRR